MPVIGILIRRSRLLDAFRQNAQQTADRARSEAQASAQQQTIYQWREQERRRLALNQRCVGGAVVQIDRSAYTQLGTLAQPINLADQPLG